MPANGERATGAEAGNSQVTSDPLRPSPVGVGSLPQRISGSDKYVLRLKLTFKALEKLKILLGSYEH